MANIYNSDLTKELIDGAKIQTSRDNIPNQIADKVVPVMEVNPRLLRKVDKAFNSIGTGTGSTIYAVPTGKPFYITNATLDLTTDAVDDGTTWEIRVTLLGEANKRILGLRKLTTTATSKTISVNYNPPIRIDDGTNIVLSGSGAVGSRSYSCIICGYEVLNEKA